MQNLLHQTLESVFMTFENHCVLDVNFSSTQTFKAGYIMNDLNSHSSCSANTW